MISSEHYGVSACRPINTHCPKTDYTPKIWNGLSGPKSVASCLAYLTHSGLLHTHIYRNTVLLPFDAPPPTPVPSPTTYRSHPLSVFLPIMVD